MTQKEKELLLQDLNLKWVDMETSEAHCYNCKLFDSKNNVCKCIDLCKNPGSTFKGFFTKYTMKQEDKQLLFKDLCARIPYGVKVQTKATGGSPTEGILWAIEDSETGTFIHHKGTTFGYIINEDIIKPYLRPLSSITEGEQKILEDFGVTFSPFLGQIRVPFNDIQFPFETTQKIISYLYSIHIDINGLIPRGLAIEVTEENNPYKE